MGTTGAGGPVGVESTEPPCVLDNEAPAGALAAALGAFGTGSAALPELGSLRLVPAVIVGNVARRASRGMLRGALASCHA